MDFVPNPNCYVFSEPAIVVSHRGNPWHPVFPSRGEQNTGRLCLAQYRLPESTRRHTNFTVEDLIHHVERRETNLFGDAAD